MRRSLFPFEFLFEKARLALAGLLFLWLIASLPTSAHPMPNSLVLMNIQQSKIRLTFRVPVQEFVLAFYRQNRLMSLESLKADQQAISRYFLQHCQLLSQPSMRWKMKLSGLKLESVSSELNGNYQELLVDVDCYAPKDWSPQRGLMLQYDAVIHQVVTHFAVIKIVQDFQQGIIPANPLEIGLIQLDVSSNRVKPLNIQLETGSQWKGWVAMVQLGMRHISEGFDHLLYILLVLLVAPLCQEERRWSNFGGVKYTAKRIGWLITAFTLGHSISLLFVALFPIPHYLQWVEVGIGITLLLAAIHAWRPWFGKREGWLTFLFGLIHGAAFASTLYDLSLPLSDKVLSVFGFNVGIELMQGVVVLLLLPLLYLSQRPTYQKLRPSLALFSALAACYWIVERI